MSDTGDPLAPWWLRRPDRLRWERANFAERGFTTRFSEGQLHTRLELSNRRVVDVVVTFPFEYPRRHPWVNVPAGLVGPPHEVNGLLCLFDDAGTQWHPQRDAAALVDENARELLEAVLVRGDRKWVAANEEQIPEPVSCYWHVDLDHVVLVPDPFWGDPEAEPSSRLFSLRGKSDRWTVTAAMGFGKATPEKIEERALCTDSVEIGRWVELNDPPGGVQSPNAILAAARAQDPNLLAPVPGGDHQLAIEWIAVTYREQGPRRGQWRRNWYFVRLTGPDTIPPAAELAPWTQPLTVRERSLRLPELDGLASAKVVLVGVGSLGSKVALELAKAGVGRLILVDPDRYDANNAVRHELPVWLAGTHKVIGMALTCQQINPFCEVAWLTTRVGDDRRSAERFFEAIQDADLVVETTGSRETTRVVDRYCRVHDVPLLTASLTRGSRGGDLVVVRGERCFDCFLIAQEQGHILRPEQGPQPLVLPVGCASPAFSGAGFDASELSSVVARTAIRVTGKAEYPELDFDWVVLNFVCDPHYTAGRLDPDPACGHLA